MDTKTVLIKPEETADAAEKQAKVEAEAEVEKQVMQQHYDDINRFLDEAEEETEKMKAAGEEIGEDQRMFMDNMDSMRTAIKMMAGENVSDEEMSDYRKQAPFQRRVTKELYSKLFSGETPEEKERTANEMRAMMGNDPIRLALIETVLRELNIVESEPDIKENV